MLQQEEYKMKTNIHIIKMVILCFAIVIGAIFMAGCSSSDSGSSDSSGSSSNDINDDSGSNTPAAFSVVSQGEIEGFGSVYVNGVKWETENVEIEIEGSAGFTESNLELGMQVVVEGNLDDSGTTGTATTIHFSDNLEGPISSIAISSTGAVKTLAVMGQTVIVEDGVTFFDDNDPTFTFATMAVGDVVEISGPTKADGSIHATFIEKKADDLNTFISGGGELEIKGIVENLGADNFQISGLTIDFSGVAPRNGTLANGVLVEVKGSALVGNTLTASDVEIKTAGLGVDDIDKAHVEGFVTDLNTAAQTFSINGQSVDYSTASFIGGTEAELLNGTKVEAEGPIVSGDLQAVKVEFKESIKFEANTETVNVGTGELTLEDLDGVTVVVDDAITEIEPAGSTLSDIVIGDEVKIRARESSDGTIVAIELEIEDEPSDRSIIQGPVHSFVSFGNVTILGVDVDTSTIENDDFKDDDIVIGRVEFFNRLAEGDLVKARFRSNAWDQIEFED